MQVIKTTPSTATLMNPASRETTRDGEGQRVSHHRHRGAWSPGAAILWPCLERTRPSTLVELLACTQLGHLVEKDLQFRDGRFLMAELRCRVILENCEVKLQYFVSLFYEFFMTPPFLGFIMYQ